MYRDTVRTKTHTEFTTWLRDPRATSPCVYHVGNLGADRVEKSIKATPINEVGNIALNASDSGFVTLTQRRNREIMGVLDYLATKTSKPLPPERILSIKIERMTR